MTRTLGSAIIIPIAILLFCANKKSKQTNQRTSASNSNAEYEKWKKNALSQKPSEKEHSKESQEPKKEEDTQTPQQKENPDQSVYSDDPEATQEDDMEDDLALLDDDDMGW